LVAVVDQVEWLAIMQLPLAALAVAVARTFQHRELEHRVKVLQVALVSMEAVVVLPQLDNLVGQVAKAVLVSRPTAPCLALCLLAKT
jgi:hypothetical protein